MRKKGIFLVFVFMLNIIFLSVGCNNGKEEELADPTEIKKKILSGINEQKHYSFQGKSSVSLDAENLEDVIEFNGFINNNENMYITLNIVGLQGMPQESMEMVKTPEKVIVKYSEEDTWETVDDEGLVYITEFVNVNPEKVFDDIDKGALETTIVEDEEGKGVLIKIDPNIASQEVKEQMNASLGDMGNLTEEQIAQMQESGLSDEEIASITEEIQAQLEEMQSMIDTIKADVTYQVYYNLENYLINEIIQTTKTSYSMMGEELEEVIVTNYKLTEYGKEKELPTT